MEAAKLTPLQLSSLRSLLLGWVANHRAYWCDGNKGDNSWFDEVQFKAPPLGRHPVTLVEPGHGCFRGAQGANGQLWLVAWNGNRPSIIASPASHFEGFLDVVKRSSSHGYRDLTLGWHMGFNYTALTYFRFDGHSYRPIASADEDWDGNLTYAVRRRRKP